MRVNEIFYSLQGEGYYTGVPAVFLRLSGCNLRCDFCDTSHQQYCEMSEDEIVERVSQYRSRHIVITGGEPTLQLTQSLLDKLSYGGFYIQIETNGSIDLPQEILDSIDWITLSPKDAPIKLTRCDELKVVFWGQDLDEIESHTWQTAPEIFSLQPLDTGDPERNVAIVEQTIRYVKLFPYWRLSLQTHKLLNIP